MLFNSIEFIAGFLPVALLGFVCIAHWRPGWPALAWLLAVSLFFYGWWDYHNLFIIVPSIAFNYALGWAIGRALAAGQRRRSALLAGLGIAANLAAIGYFKYVGFLTSILAGLTGFDFQVRRRSLIRCTTRSS
jgi:alginate O-acetyltransferase complex protein AlgI